MTPPTKTKPDKQSPTKARRGNERPKLINLGSDTEFLLAQSSNVKLNTADAPSGKEMSLAARAALALTEACVMSGKGKVYHYVPNATLKSPHSAPVKRFDAAIEMSAYPELFYIPEVWDHESAKAWNGKRPLEKLYHLDNRNGWIPDHMYVLPFALSYNESTEQSSNLVIGGVNESPVTLVLNPGIHLIPTREIRKAKLVVKHAATTLRPWGFEWHPAVQDQFARWEVDGLQRAIQRLNELYTGAPVKDYTQGYHTDQRYICLFRTIHERVVAAASRAFVNHNQP